jgi:hypothetical protein
MGIASEYEELAVKLKGIDDLQMIVTALRNLGRTKYNRGYRDCALDRRRVKKGCGGARERCFQEELETISDVMSGPFDIDHQ